MNQSPYELDNCLKTPLTRGSDLWVRYVLLPAEPLESPGRPMQVEAAKLWDVQTTALQIIHLGWWRVPGWFSKEAVHKPRLAYIKVGNPSLSLSVLVNGGGEIFSFEER